MKRLQQNRWAGAMLALGLLGSLAIGCDDNNQQSATPPAAPAAQAASESLPANLVVAAPAPADAKDVAAARGAADGDEVVVRGRVGGHGRPFAEGRALFQLVDLEVQTCDKANPTEGCRTPWDYCCEDRTLVLNKSLTVQVVGPSGQPVRASLNGVGGLKPMSEVAVKGTVKKSPDGKAVTVNATELYVKQG